MARHWIANRIDELDPTTHYDEIWKLATAYKPTDFIMNLIYAVTFPHFFVRRLDALPLFDGGTGKILKKPDARSDDTSWKMQVWWHYGSEHEKTRQNVESINRIHEHYAKTYPESFGRNGTYIYTLCYEAAGMHRLMLRVGLKGISEKEKTAAVHYWSNMATIFRNATSGAALTGFPDTFDGIMNFMDEWEGEVVPKHEMGVPAANAIIQQFATKYFHPLLHPLVFKWIISLYPDHLISAYDLKRPSTLTVKAMRFFTACFLWVGEHIAPDPKDTFTERRKAAQARTKAPQTPSYKPESSVGEMPLSGCPHLRQQQLNAINNELKEDPQQHQH